MFEYPPQIAAQLIDALGDHSKGLPLLERFVEVLFFASLLREEGSSLRFGVVYPGVLDVSHPTPERVHGYAPWTVLDLEHVDFDPANSAKLASLGEEDDNYLVVHCVDKMLVLSGVGHNKDLPWYAFEHRVLTARVVGAGHIRFFFGAAEILSYTSGNAVKPLKWPFASPQASMKDVTAAVAGLTTFPNPEKIASVALSRLCAELVRRGHGGIIAICSDSDSEYQQNIDARRLKGSIEFGRLFAASWEASCVSGSKPNPTHEQMLEDEQARATSEHALNLIGRMSMVDGAVLMTPDLRVVGFGAKLPASTATPAVVAMSAAGTHEDFDMARRGTRHRGAACFVAGSDSRIALIVSADGDAAAMFKVACNQVLYWSVRDFYSV